MDFPVIRGVSYALVHARDMIVHQGSAANNERRLAPDSEYLAQLSGCLRSFEEVVAYPPNQVYIGNMVPKMLDGIARPWYEKPVVGAGREGKHGEIMPQDEFLGLVKAVDAFGLVLLEEDFENRVASRLRGHKALSGWSCLDKLGKSPSTQSEIEELLAADVAEPMYFEDVLVGCVKKAHDFDPALSKHVMFENLVSKASAAFCMALLFKQGGLAPEQVDYIIECSEEACGDMNQRGGGNFAKAIGEVAGCVNATGSDVRGFCAAPVHAIVMAAALVQSGVYKDVVVVAGGASAKLGMNGKDHVKKGMPVLEDVLGAFAVHISQNDGSSPQIRTDIVGRHSIGTGSGPQAVTQAIVSDPLTRAGLMLADIDAFSVEMQNPELTEPAGAGDVPKANYKMIAALGVMRKEFERSQLNEVIEKISMPGFAPTQGHIPSGVPFLGHCKDMIEAGEMQRAMIIGKGSLFLGRLTNLFDGVSFLVEKNRGTKTQTIAATEKTRVGLSLHGSEHGEEEIQKGAELVKDPSIEVVTIEGGHSQMDEMLQSGQIDAAVTMHYNFPIGVSTVGRAVSPGKGRSVYIANTTGSSDTERVKALIKNTIQAIAVAKACGNARPTVGILNIDGARSVERALKAMQAKGYDINFTESSREDGGVLMRGNDLLAGTPDIMVMDSLTGNVVMKTLSAYTTGGDYEATGDGYGPGVGEGFNRVINIISRASGAPVVAGAIAYAAACAKGKLPEKLREEFSNARKAGLDEHINTKSKQEPTKAEITSPPEKIVTEEIPGIEILELDEAVHTL